MNACAGSKANGEHCRGLVATGSDYCPAHEPRRQKARRRAASKAARSKGKGGLDELYGQARRLYDQVQQGTIDPKVGTVLVQAVNVQTRILELQRRIELANVLTPEQVEYETKILLDIMRRNIKDKEVLSAISDEMSALVGEDY